MEGKGERRKQKFLKQDQTIKVKLCFGGVGVEGNEPYGF